MENEIWKDIVGYEGQYQISNKGIVKSLDRNIKGSWSSIGKRLTGQILKLKNDKAGYKIAGLRRSGQKFIKVHRLVAIAFIPNPNNYAQVNHINGIKNDNSVSNLEWASASMNQRHRYTHLGQKGHWADNKMKIRDNNPCSFLNTKTNEILHFGSYAQCARFLKATQPNVAKSAREGYLLLGVYKFQQIKKDCVLTF